MEFTRELIHAKGSRPKQVSSEPSTSYCFLVPVVSETQVFLFISAVRNLHSKESVFLVNSRLLFKIFCLVLILKFLIDVVLVSHFKCFFKKPQDIHSGFTTGLY